MIARLGLLALTGCQVVFPLDADPVPSSSDPRFVQSASIVQNGVAEIELAFPRPVLDQDLIVVAVGTYQNNLTELSDSSGNTYQEASGFVQTPLLGRLHVLYTHAVEAETLTVKVRGAPEAEPQLTVAIHAYRGIDPDAVVSKSTQVGTTDTPTTEVTLVADTALMFAAMTHDEAGDAKPGPGFVRRERPTDNARMDVPMITEDRFGVSAGLGEATFTLGANVPWAIQLITFE